MVGAAAVEDMSRIFLALGGLRCGSPPTGLRGVVGREATGVTDAVEGVPEFLRIELSLETILLLCYHTSIESNQRRVQKGDHSGCS